MLRNIILVGLFPQFAQRVKKELEKLTLSKVMVVSYQLEPSIVLLLALLYSVNHAPL